jgi:hypothetical protein
MFNSPLRGVGAYAGKPHPLPVTTAFINDGIKRLRAIGASHADGAKAKDFWRGMRNLELAEGFLEAGGTELAPMSTSSDVRVALHYSSQAEKRLIFKIASANFLDRGADLRYLSAFPAESECTHRIDGA